MAEVAAFGAPLTSNGTIHWDENGLPGFSMGEGTHRVCMSMHAGNREVLCARLAVAGIALDGVFAVFQGGSEVPRYDTDTAFDFKQESNFQYLFGVKEPDCFGAVGLKDARSALFIPRLPQEYASWMGPIKSTECFQKMYAVDDVFYVDEMAEVLKSELKATSLAVVMGTNRDSGIEFKSPEFDGMSDFNVNTEFSAKFSEELSESRVVKSPMEIEVLQFVNDVSSMAHVEVMRQSKAFLREYVTEATFRYQSFLRGCSGTGYNCICPSGTRNTILHYGHAAEPNPEQVLPGELRLNDMGAEYHGYTSDITCCYPVDKFFSRDQKIVYETVWAATLAVEKAVCPGVAFKDMHRLSQRIMLQEMVKHGLFKGDVEDMMKVDLCGNFMAHGLGHNMGLDVHDVGGYKPGESRKDDPLLKQNLRLGRELQEGQVLTVEPGFYFTDFLVAEALKDPAKAKFIQTKMLEQLRPVGGVRIEDDIVITAKGCRVLTKVPRTVREINAVMAGAEWNVGIATSREYIAPDYKDHGSKVAHYTITTHGKTLASCHAKALVESHLKENIRNV